MLDWGALPQAPVSLQLTLLLGFLIALIALPAIILGGLDSLAGAVIGGLAVGVTQQLVGSYSRDVAPWLGDNVASVAPYGLMLLVLLFRPYGLFGTPEVRRV